MLIWGPTIVMAYIGTVDEVVANTFPPSPTEKANHSLDGLLVSTSNPGPSYEDPNNSPRIPATVVWDEPAGPCGVKLCTEVSL